MEPQTGYAEVNDARLYFEQSGAGQPLILLHGFSLDMRMWDAQFPALAQHYRVIRYDLRGFGRSSVPTTTPYAHADDLKALLDHFGIERAHIMALSMGGGIAVDFALAHPECVDRLILIDSTLGGYQWPEAWDDTVKPIWKHGRAGDIASARLLWLAHPLFESVLSNAQCRDQFHRIVEDYSGWHWLNRDPGLGLTPPAIGRLNALESPALIVIGERDLAGFQAIADLLQKEIPDARKVELKGVGHMSNMEAPELLNGVVLNYLNEASPSRK